MKERMLHLKEVAALVDVTPKTLYRMVWRGEGPEVTVLRSSPKQRLLRFSRAAVDQWLLKRTEKGPRNVQPDNRIRPAGLHMGTDVQDP